MANSPVLDNSIQPQAKGARTSVQFSGTLGLTRAKPVLSKAEGTPRTQSEKNFFLAAFAPLRETI
jgi:hypothetical protein